MLNSAVYVGGIQLQLGNIRRPENETYHVLIITLSWSMVKVS